MRRSLLLALVLLSVLPAAALAAQPRIVNGQPASEGDYPSQGFLLIDLGGGFAGCGGTVVAPETFVTAAHCVADESGAARPPAAFEVFLGEVNQSEFGSAERPEVIGAVIHPDYAEDPGEQTNDVAVLTFANPVSAAPARIIRPGETALWAPGAMAQIIGWGATEEGGDGSDTLLEAAAPIRSDADCAAAYRVLFVPSTMVCAGEADPPESTDTCQGDSGGPLLVGSPGARALAGVVSWGNGCNRAGFPGVYTRLGAPALNAWVRGRAAGVDFAPPAAPRAGEPAAFTATAPAGGDFAWDFDDDGVFDATGASASHVYATAGEFEAVLRVTDAEGEPAEQRRELIVTPGAGPPPPPPPAPPAVTPPSTLRLATILVSGRPRVRAGRFRIRVRFAANAPRGTARIEVFRRGRKIGAGTTRVRRGDSKQVSVKLTKAGRRQLRRSAGRRLRVRLRVRVGRRILGSKTLTIRR